MRSIILHVTSEDTSYLPVVKPIITGRAKTYIDTTVPTAAYEFVLKSRQKDGAAIATTSQKLLSLILPFVDNPKIDDYAGSLIKFNDVDFLILDPLEQLVSKTTGKFIFKRFLDKLLQPENWLPEPAFKWELFSPTRLEVYLEFFAACDLIAIDIETVRDDPLRTISCVGYCGVQLVGTTANFITVVVPLDSEYNLAFVRYVNQLSVAKVLQNGKYDTAYFMRYGAPVYNYGFDTINLFHGWYSELPKDLGFISAFCVRGYSFHKNDGRTGNKIDYYEYNAKDCYYTLLTCMSLLLEIPTYAEKNYLQEFPLVFPCILSEQTGIKWDKDAAGELKKKVELELELELDRLSKMVAIPNFNPSSPQQVQRLFQVLGSKDITSTTPPMMDKVANRHPLNKVILDKITSYRKNRKLNTSYFKEGVEWNGRVYYALNPHGTDTGRLASRESQYWCGLQIQNIPRDRDDEVNVKHAFIADNGFLFGEADFSQAEARDTAYLSGDTALIAAVDDTTKDFHGVNASKFFGLPYEQIVNSYQSAAGEWIHKTINKAIRDLAKRTNHGANYNMGARVMLDTMGIQKVLTAKKLLGLPDHWSLLQVTSHLLDVYAKTYPVVKGAWYDKVVSDVMGAGYLIGPTGWTRRCFGNPKANKLHLNSYVAHPPQSLNAMTLNKAYLAVFQYVYLPNPTNFKLCAQNHDSILFQYRVGYEHLAWEVKEHMCIPTEVIDTFGIRRTLTVPVDLKGGSRRWSEVTALKKQEKKVAA